MKATIPAAVASHDAPRRKTPAGLAEVLPPQTMYAPESAPTPPRIPGPSVLGVALVFLPSWSRRCRI
jgi:hypothetical protein